MAEITLMDGGMGQELIARSSNPVHPLWSTFVMLHEPDIVRDVHQAYLQAGARVLTINAYAVTPPRLANSNLEAHFDDLQSAACRLAAEARDAAEIEDVAIAGCLPPLVASYDPDATPPLDQALADYRRIAEAQAPHVDLFLCETMSSAAEARAAATAAAETGKPVWVAWTLVDGGAQILRSGEGLAAANAALDGLPIAAKLVNCSHPESFDAAMPELAGLGGPFGAYANAFKSVDGMRLGGTVAHLRARDDMDPAAYADFALGWVDAGAQLVGGCCEIGPAHIAELARRLPEAGHTVIAWPPTPSSPTRHPTGDAS